MKSPPFLALIDPFHWPIETNFTRDYNIRVSLFDSCGLLVSIQKFRSIVAVRWHAIGALEVVVCPDSVRLLHKMRSGFS